jgi:PAS domain S-box-containing protein
MADQNESDENSQQLASIIESSSDSIISKDLNGTITSWNNGAALIYGYSPAEAVGKPISIIIPPERRAEFVDILERIRRGEKIDHYETTRLRKDGTRIDVSITVSPVRNKKGEVIGASSITRDITERKRANQVLFESEARYHSIMDQAAESIIMHDETGRITDANRKACESLGYSREELLSKSIEDIDPEAVRAEKDKLWTAVLAGEIFTFESNQMRKDGSLIPVEVTLGPVHLFQKTAVLAIARDITERKHTEGTLRESETRYRMLVESAAESILILQDGMIKMVNAMGSVVTGFSQQELVSMPFLRLIHPDDRAMVEERHRRRLGGEAVPSGYDFRVLAKDGSTKWAEVRAVAIDWKGRPATLNLLSDITERKRVEMELKRKTAEAVEYSRRAGSYFDFLAHDIANMLSPIMVYAELISLDTKTPEPSKIKAGKIVNQTRRASSFILSLRRLEDAELISQERMESRDLGTIMDGAITRVKAEYADKRISVTVIQAAEKVMFKGGKHLESIILGILENSVGAAERDDIALQVEAAIVEENSHKFLRLELTDDGPGISDELKECFMVSEDPRKQFETGISRGVASTLLISSAIVKSLGGGLWVEDRIQGDCSKGSRIVIEFPQEGFFGT